MNFIEKINTFLKTKNVKLWHILMASLVFNAFALLTLSRGLFIIFLLLTINVFFLIRLSNIYILNNKTQINPIELKLKNITEWFILLTIILFINKKYQNKLTPFIFLLFFIILLLNNLNFSVRNAILYNKGFKLKKSIDIWIKPLKNISNQKINILHKYTKYFNELYTIIYLLILIIYINYKK